MIPSSWCSGVKLTEDSGVAVSHGYGAAHDTPFRTSRDCHKARTPTPSPSWRVQSATLGGRFFACQHERRLRPPRQARQRRRESGGVLRALCRLALSSASPGRSASTQPNIIFLFMNVTTKCRYTPEIFTLVLGVNPYRLFRRDIALNQFPHRRTFGALVHAGPACDHIFFLRLDRLARISDGSLTKCADLSVWKHRSRSRGRRNAPCRRPADSRDLG